MTQSFLRNALSKSQKLPSSSRGFLTAVTARRSTRIFFPCAPQAPLVVAGSCAAMYSDPRRLYITQTEASIPVPIEQITLPSQTTSRWTRIKRKVHRALVMFARLVKLSVALAPIALLFPLQAMRSKSKDEDAHAFVLAEDSGPSGLFLWYLNMCLLSVEWSGAAVIKLMQWAGSRPDLFGHDFCSIFSRLQDNTSPHAWKHTVQKMEEAFGEDWATRIQLHEVLGSGCIGQVYKGVILDTNQEVAVKVMHPNVRQDIDTDLDLMRLAADFFSKLGKVKFLNLQGAVDEFAGMLKLQLDLRTEAENLDRFNTNFKDDPYVVFPKLIPGFVTTKDILVESFCAGIPVLKYARENQDDQETLSKLCLVGIRAICKMIFNDNFLHGDLHPGECLMGTHGYFIFPEFSPVSLSIL
jgi:aarF domain-containing kinase